MAGVDPASVLLGLSNRIAAAADAAIAQAALDLGISADLLQAQIAIGDVLAAKILPPQNGHDLIEILGRAVAAQLPPGVHPRETLSLQVTGFDANRILVRNLGVTEEPPQPPPASPPPQRASAGYAPAAARPPLTQMPVQDVDARIAAAQTSRTPPAAAVAAAPVPLASSAAPETVRRTVQNAVRQVVRTVGDLLKSAKLPDTPLTRTAAAIAPQAPQRLPSVLARLENALPAHSDDPRIATLKTLIAFTARLNPAHEATLPAQIEAYVSHAVAGAEPKLRQLLQALQQQTPAPAESASQPPQAQSPAQTPTAPEAPPQPAAQNAVASLQQPLEHPVPQPPVHSLAQARAAERSAALDHNLKAVVLSLLRDPPAERTPTLLQALNETFITLTATQINTLTSNAQTPNAIAIALPVFFKEGGKPAQLRIEGDGAAHGAELDAGNFRVAFVLDTANLGTVAIDLQSSGRTVKIDVKTEGKPAAARFAATLSALSERLETLRYRVASATAAALPAAAAPARRQASQAAPSSGVDLRA